MPNVEVVSDPFLKNTNMCTIRPPSWCDVHHIRHWEDGGETSLSDRVLLCRRHHHLIHEEGFIVEMTDKGPLFRRPDGSMIEDNRAPP